MLQTTKIVVDNPKQPRTRKSKERGPSATTPSKQTKLMKTIKIHIDAMVAYRDTKTMVTKLLPEGDNTD